MEIKINTHGHDMPYQAAGGDWIDLYTAEETVMKAGDFRLISLGVSMEIPEGYEAIVAPRSSTPGRYGVIMANSIGVIDNAYNGDGDVWRFPAFAIRDTYIPDHTRIAQFRLFKNQEPVAFRVVSRLGNKDRGGIGSTGTGKEVEK